MRCVTVVADARRTNSRRARTCAYAYSVCVSLQVLCIEVPYSSAAAEPLVAGKWPPARVPACVHGTARLSWKRCHVSLWPGALWSHRLPPFTHARRGQDGLRAGSRSLNGCLPSAFPGCGGRHMSTECTNVRCTNIRTYCGSVMGDVAPLHVYVCTPSGGQAPAARLMSTGKCVGHGRAEETRSCQVWTVCLVTDDLVLLKEIFLPP